jgi:tryptophan-rich sensory protein
MTKNRKTSKPSLSTWGKIWRIMLAIAVSLGGGIIVSLFTRSAMDTFGRLNQPPLSPPAILFPIAWTILYVYYGVVLRLILTAVLRY